MSSKSPSRFHVLTTFYECLCWQTIYLSWKGYSQALRKCIPGLVITVLSKYWLWRPPVLQFDSNPGLCLPCNLRYSIQVFTSHSRWLNTEEIPQVTYIVEEIKFHYEDLSPWKCFCFSEITLGIILLLDFRWEGPWRMRDSFPFTIENRRLREKK